MAPLRRQNSIGPIEFVYDASGNLLTKTVTYNAGPSPIPTTTDYIKGIEYVNDVMASIYHDEGRLVHVNGTWQSEYVIKDHLGNARVTFRDNDNNGFITASDITQEANYYPFGMQMEGSWSPAAAVRIPYLYNGIEHVSDLGLDINTALFRTLDPALGRWWQIDPKAEAFYGLTPYNSMGNNPTLLSDPKGDHPVLIGMLIGAVINAGIQYVRNDFSFKNFDVGSFIGAVVSGAVGGGVGQALAAAHIGGFAGGAITGAASGFSGSLVTGIINNQQNLLGNVLQSTVMGAAIGGAIGALDVVYKNATNGNEMDLRIWDGREIKAVQREIVWGGDGTPRRGTVRNMASSKRNGITQRQIPANPSGTRMVNGISSKTVEINAGFEGDLTITGAARPAPGETFQILADNRLVFSTNLPGTPINLTIPSSNSTITWQLTGMPANTGAQDFRNSFINITGTHRGWSGFLFFR